MYLKNSSHSNCFFVIPKSLILKNKKALGYRFLSFCADRQYDSIKAWLSCSSVMTAPPPFRQHPRYSESFTFSAKERDSETGLSYFGSRYYSSDLSIWLSVDPMAAKYPSLSPYVYCADNPVMLVDPNGEEIVLETIYKKDANGNDTKEIERYNIRITGKIINTSQTRINTQEARDEIVSQIESSFSGVTKKGIPVTTTADFEVVNSLQDVRKSDHLIILSNGVNLGNFDNTYGKVDQIGGRIAWVDANLFIGLSGLLTKKGAKTAAHEMGHLLGLEHSSAKGLRNLMNSHCLGGSKISSHQLSIIIHLLKIDKNIKTPSLKHVNKQ